MSSALDKLAKRQVAPNPVSFERVLEIPLNKIRFDSTQPRKAFHTIDGAIAEKDSAYITELAESIEHKGLIQNITLQEMPDGSYLVVVGECRTRAHLQLGRATIKAVVRNDLINVSQRLLYQLAENVNRQDLTDYELAASIRVLLAGSDTVAPMSQVQIAKTLGKSEGWVSRFIKFGDEELQRLWVKTGIADTVEKLYRLSILPKSMQVDVIRRVELAEDHPEFLGKPLLRDVIDSLTREAKIGKIRLKTEQNQSLNLESVVSTVSNEPFIISSPSKNDLVIAADPLNPMVKDPAAEVIADHINQYDAEKLPLVKPTTFAEYQLPDAARAAILGMQPSESADTNNKSESRDEIEPPVKCRVSICNIDSLLEALKKNEQALIAFDGVRCELNIPGPLAQLISNELTGIVVDRREVPSILLIELAKLD